MRRLLKKEVSLDTYTWQKKYGHLTSKAMFAAIDERLKRRFSVSASMEEIPQVRCLPIRSLEYMNTPRDPFCAFVLSMGWKKEEKDSYHSLRRNAFDNAFLFSLVFFSSSKDL
jgi:hypothetical protein